MNQGWTKLKAVWDHCEIVTSSFTWHAVITETVPFDEIIFWSRPGLTSLYGDDGTGVSKIAGWHDFPSSANIWMIVQMVSH